MEHYIDLRWVPVWILIYVLSMDPHKDPTWIPIWILYGPLYRSYMSPYIWVLMWILYGSLYGSYMDPIWILYGSTYEGPQASNCDRHHATHALMTHEALTIRDMFDS